MRIRFGFSAVAVLTLSTMNSGSAQTGRPVSQEELATRLAGQSRIKLRLDSGREVELAHPMVAGDAIRGTLRGTGTMVEQPIAEVDRVWRRGSAAKTGLAIGAALGAIAGAAGGVAMTQFCILGPCASPTTSDQVGAAVGGAGMGMIVGGLVGAAIAAPVRRWKLMYRSEVIVTPVVSPGRVGVSVVL